MGKTSLELSMAKDGAQFHDLPVCFFGLEMSKEQHKSELGLVVIDYLK